MEPDIKDILLSTIGHLYFLGKKEEGRLIVALVELARQKQIVVSVELFKAIHQTEDPGIAKK